MNSYEQFRCRKQNTSDFIVSDELPCSPEVTYEKFLCWKRKQKEVNSSASRLPLPDFAALRKNLSDVYGTILVVYTVVNIS